MDKYVNWVNEIKIQNTIKSLEDNNMKGYFANDKNELIKQSESYAIRSAGRSPRVARQFIESLL